MSAQLENGYSKIANELLEQVALLKLSPTELKLILVIWRYTYGFQRNEHELSLTFLSKATDSDKRNVQRYLAELDNRKIIYQRFEGQKRYISFNNNYNEWLGKSTIGNSTNGKTTNGNSTNGTIGNSTNGTIGNSTNQEINKKNIKENDIYIIPYEEIVLYLNEKAGTNFKASTGKTKDLIRARWNEGFTLDDFKKVIDNKVRTWMGTDYQQYLRPPTLFGTKFESYLNETGGRRNERTTQRSDYDARLEELMRLSSG